MYCNALLNSLNWMNCVAGTLPCAFGEQGELPAFWHPASGSGKTRPRAEYWPSSVATGEAPAAGADSAASTKTAAARASRRVTVVLPSRGRLGPLRNARADFSSSGNRARQSNSELGGGHAGGAPGIRPRGPWALRAGADPPGLDLPPLGDSRLGMGVDRLADA